MTAEYDAYLESEEWKALRTRIFEQANGRCVLCNRPANNLHHRTYERVGKELDGDVTALCRDCHALFHEFYKTGHRHHDPKAVAPPQPRKIPEQTISIVPMKTESPVPAYRGTGFIEHLEKRAKDKQAQASNVFARQCVTHTNWSIIRPRLLICAKKKEITALMAGLWGRELTSSEKGCVGTFMSRMGKKPRRKK
uniref:HNH endonuclease n=1 Tax=viral metagenome TaxID=1070528 RepID=A0A6M3XZJ3_9ZZZZ